MPFALKRKRGRPRRDESKQINNFDIMLIQEYRKRPILYDLTHSLHKERQFMDEQWAEIASKMRNTVPMVKERILQLRNRYNLEKRRIIELQGKFNDGNITSSWSLYSHLDFLSKHIKKRRPIYDDGESDESEVDVGSGPGARFSNTKAEVFAGIQANQQHVQQHQAYQKQQQQQAQQTYQQKEQQKCNAQSHLMTSNMNLQRNHINNAFVNGSVHQPSSDERHIFRRPLPRTPDRFETFKAFGQFLASSLVEMCEEDALRLVEKFTVEVVRAIRDNKANNASKDDN